MENRRKKIRRGSAIEENIDPSLARELRKKMLVERDMERMYERHGGFSRTFGGDSDKRFGRK